MKEKNNASVALPFKNILRNIFLKENLTLKEPTLKHNGKLETNTQNLISWKGHSNT